MEKTDKEAAALTVILLAWSAYLFLLGIRLIALGAGVLSWPFSWRELEIAGGFAIISAIASFFIWIHE